MKRRSVLALACLVAAMPMWPQSTTGNQSFDEFRKGMLDNYNQFRRSILDDYDKFLGEAWANYQKIKGEDRYADPKPATVPVARPDVEPVVYDLPAPAKPKPVKAKRKPEVTPSSPAPAAPSKPVRKPKTPAAPEKPAPSPAEKTAPSPAEKAAPPAEKPTPAPAAAPAAEPSYTFPFYSIEFSVKDRPLLLEGKLRNSSDYAAQWRKFVSSDAKAIIPELNRIAAENSLNDYLTFEMMRSYVDSRYADAHPTVRVALEHYLLANMGYDVRIAVDDDGTPLLLMPFRQYVYTRPYLMFGDKRYYVFEPRGSKLNANTSISTCKLPSDSDVDLGRPMDLLFTNLTIPEKMKDFHLTYDGIELKGQVNENIFPIIYHYPLMTIGDFAQSTISPQLRADLVNQFKNQLDGLTEAEAVDKLLKFTQKAFEYATDGDFHGFEKPYFIEEILYYPKCDCEDRSIFYTYMLWNVLGLENHLLAYPNHESASVKLSSPIEGSGYDYEGKHFYISDPTYIGASTGMCMRPYKNTKPDIDYIYK